MDRIADAFTWPARDQHWLSNTALIALILLVPVVGAINALGWMLANLDRLRAGDETLAPAGFGYVGRGFRLFVVQLAYGLALAAVVLAVYVPAVAVLSREGGGPGSVALAGLGFVLSSLGLGVGMLGGVVLTAATPAIVLATDAGGIAGGLAVGDVIRRARASTANTLIAGLMLIAAGFVGSLGAVACGIGVVFTVTYSLAMQAWIVRSFEMGSPASLRA